jgi:hypothetical protein
LNDHYTRNLKDDEDAVMMATILLLVLPLVGTPYKGDSRVYIELAWKKDVTSFQAFAT